MSQNMSSWGSTLSTTEWTSDFCRYDGDAVDIRMLCVPETANKINVSLGRGKGHVSIIVKGCSGVTPMKNYEFQMRIKRVLIV